MKCQWFGAISRKVHPFKTEPSVIWTHGAEGSGQFRSLLIQTKVNVTANHLNFPHFDNSAFCNIFAKSNRFDAFLRSPFARMAELVDALDSKSNVLKKTCRFEPGFGLKKMRVFPLIFLCPDDTFCLIGEWFPQSPSVASLHGLRSFTLIFLCPVAQVRKW